MNTKEYHRKYYQEHRKAKDEAARKWRLANPTKYARIMRRARYRNRYGSTVADYDFLLHIQGGKCGVCGCAEPTDRYFDVDHDHFTGEVRGLLCTGCNRLVGQAEHLQVHSPDLLDKIEKYLQGKVELLEY